MSSEIDWKSFAIPLDSGAPCGPDLVDDPAFLALETAGEGEPEQEIGKFVQEATGPDWAGVHELALALAARTRDLRVLIWLTRSVARRTGFEDAVHGLQLIHTLIEQQWADVHPQPEGDDYTRRMNAFATLSDPNYFIADLRHCALHMRRGKALRVRDLELALGHDKPHEHEQVLSQGELLDALQVAAAASPSLQDSMKQGYATAQAIERRLNEQVGAVNAPELGSLLRLLKFVATSASRLAGSESQAQESAPGEPALRQSQSAGTRPISISVPGAIESREDVLRTLDRVCDWIDRNEPTNPAPLLIRRAQKLLKKDFVKIIEDLLGSSAADEIRKLAGITNA
jgi:type VI secretion system protein ImpA